VEVSTTSKDSESASVVAPSKPPATYVLKLPKRASAQGVSGTSMAEPILDQLRAELARRHDARRSQAEEKGVSTGTQNLPAQADPIAHPYEGNLREEYQGDVEHLGSHAGHLIETLFSEYKNKMKQLKAHEENPAEVEIIIREAADEHGKRIEHLEAEREERLQAITDYMDKQLTPPYLRARESLKRLQQKLGRDHLDITFKSTKLYFVLLAVIGACEFPLNMKVFETFREGVTQTMIMAFSLVVGIPIAAHFEGLFLKRRKDHPANPLWAAFIAVLLVALSVYVGLLRAEYILASTGADSSLNTQVFVTISIFLFSIGTLLSFAHHDENSQFQAAYREFDTRERQYEEQRKVWESKRENLETEIRKRREDLDTELRSLKAATRSRSETAASAVADLKARHDSVLGQVKSIERQIQHWYVASVHVFREANLGNRSNHMSPRSFAQDPPPLNLSYSRHAALDQNPLDESR